MTKAKGKFSLGRFFLYLVLSLAAATIFIPFIWGVLSSFKTANELSLIPPTLFPKQLAWENYTQVLSGSDFLRNYWNSFVITVGTTAGTLLVCSFTGYALAKFEFKGKTAIFLIFLGTMMLPAQLTMIPVFILTTNLGLINTHLGVILPGIASAYGVFLMRQFMMNIPNEVLEAARIDGCGELRMMFRIVMPLSSPILATLTILTVLSSWNQFLMPLILLNSPEMATVQLAMSNYQNDFGQQLNLLMAASVLAVIPVAIVFLFCQKYIVAGISMGSVKG